MTKEEKETAMRIIENDLYNIKHTDGKGMDIPTIIAKRRTYEYCKKLIRQDILRTT